MTYPDQFDVAGDQAVLARVFYDLFWFLNSKETSIDIGER
jgi:hypothetical protein